MTIPSIGEEILSNPGGAIVFYFLSVLFAYKIVGLQSIMYSIVMEALVNPKIDNTCIVICISAGLGVASAAVVGFDEAAVAGFNEASVLVGALTGAISGVYLRLSYIKSANKSIERTV